MVRVRRLNLEGDQQADLSVHGGADKAVYVYPAEHYPYWRRELGREDLPWGTFGENLTVEGLLEDAARIGDRFEIGSARFQITQPRMPCYKLAMKLGRDDIIKKFLASGRTGWYFSVLEEGEIQAGQPVATVERDGAGLTVSDVTRLYTSEKGNLDLLRRAIGTAALSENWKGYFRHQMEKVSSPPPAAPGSARSPRG